MGAAFTPLAKTIHQTPLGWSYNGPTGKPVNTYEFDWDANHDPHAGLGYYEFLLSLNDGTLQTSTIQLTKNKSGKLTADGSGGAGTPTGGQLLAGERLLYVDNSDGLLTADERSRVEDALATVNALVAPYGASFVEVEAADSAAADIVLDVAATSALGGYADGVLGCTSDGAITLVRRQRRDADRRRPVRLPNGGDARAGPRPGAGPQRRCNLGHVHHPRHRRCQADAVHRRPQRPGQGRWRLRSARGAATR